MEKKFYLALILSGILLINRAQADPQLFGYIKSAETLPQGRWEIYQVTSVRSGKDSGSFRAIDAETEFELGLTNRLQGSVSILQQHYQFNGVTGLTDGSFYRLTGVELESRYALSSVYKDPIGIALQAELAQRFYSPNDGEAESEFLLEPGLLLQKNFLDDTLSVVMNTNVEFAWATPQGGSTEQELELSGALGASYLFMANWSVGLESRIRSSYSNFDLGQQQHVATYAGPCLHYANENWSLTAAWTPQVWGWGVGETGRQTFADETLQSARLKLVFNF